MFAGDVEGRDLILVGKLDARTKDEAASTTVTEFAGRVAVEEDGEGKVRISAYQAFMGMSNTTK